MTENECKNTQNYWFGKKKFCHVEKSVYFCTRFQQFGGRKSEVGISYLIPQTSYLRKALVVEW